MANALAAAMGQHRFIDLYSLGMLSHQLLKCNANAIVITEEQ